MKEAAAERRAQEKQIQLNQQKIESLESHVQTLVSSAEAPSPPRTPERPSARGRPSAEDYISPAHQQQMKVAEAERRAHENQIQLNQLKIESLESHGRTLQAQFELDARRQTEIEAAAQATEAAAARRGGEAAMHIQSRKAEAEVASKHVQLAQLAEQKMQALEARVQVAERIREEMEQAVETQAAEATAERRAQETQIQLNQRKIKSLESHQQRNEAATTLQGGFHGLRARKDGRRMLSAHQRHLKDAESERVAHTEYAREADARMRSLEKELEVEQSRLGIASDAIVEAEMLATMAREAEQKALSTVERVKRVAEVEHADAERAKLELAYEKKAKLSASATESQSREQWEIKLRTAQGLVRETEHRLYAVERRSKEATEQQVEEAVQEALLRAAQSADAALERVRLDLETKAAAELAEAVARVRAEADASVQQVSAQQAHGRVVSTEVHTSIPIGGRMDASGVQQWEILLHENTELRGPGPPAAVKRP
jgi:hypothetical protein